LEASWLKWHLMLQQYPLLLLLLVHHVVLVSMRMAALLLALLVVVAAGLMLSAASTYAPKNIRGNCVAPGLTRTLLAERITSNPAALKASEGMHALKR
jgi:hypothetical protein